MMAPSPTDQKIAALQQRYAQSQQLIDLLALQKLKQEKDAAARDMQMKAAQQMGGMGMPSVKDQLENEMVGRSKQEVTEQLNTIAAQKQQQQQQALQRVAETGIAQNPTPMNFAGGGIVAFAEGGEAETEEEKLQRLMQELARLKETRPSGPSVSARGGAREPSALQRGIAGIGQSIRNVFTPREDKIKQLEAQIAKQQQASAPQRGTLGDGFEAIAQTVSDMPSAMPQGQPQPAAPRAPAPQGIAAAPRAPAAPGAQPAAAPEDPIRKMLVEQLSGMATQDPLKAAAEEEQYVEGRRQLTPEQRGVYEQGIAAAQRRLQELSDPQKMRDEARIRGMLATAGGGNFAAYGAGSLNAQEQQRLNRKQAEEDYAKAAEGLVGIERAVVDKALEARGTERKEGRATKLGALKEVGGVYQVDKQAETAGLDRASREYIAKIQVDAQREANRIQAETNRTLKTDAEYRRTVDSMNRYVNDVSKPYDRMIENLMETVSISGKPTPEQQTQLNNLRKARDLAVQNIRDQYEPMLNKYNPEGGEGGFKVIGSRPGK